MALEEHLTDIEELSDNEKQAMIERSQELQAAGASQKEADMTVLAEFQDDINKDLRTLKGQVGVDPGTPEGDQARNEAVREREKDALKADYRKGFMNIGSGEAKNLEPEKE